MIFGPTRRIFLIFWHPSFGKVWRLAGELSAAEAMKVVAGHSLGEWKTTIPLISLTQGFALHDLKKTDKLKVSRVSNPPQY